MKEYTLTIKIAKGGTTYISEENVESKSMAGHMWYSVWDGEGEQKSFGYNSGEKITTPIGRGKVSGWDNEAYVKIYYKLDIPISEEQYDKLIAFGKERKEHGFTGIYNVITNSCIDFTWKALEHANIKNLLNEEGSVLPVNNAKSIDRIVFGEKHWEEFHDYMKDNSKGIDKSVFETLFHDKDTIKNNDIHKALFLKRFEDEFEKFIDTVNKDRILKELSTKSEREIIEDDSISLDDLVGTEIGYKAMNDKEAHTEFKQKYEKFNKQKDKEEQDKRDKDERDKKDKDDDLNRLE